MLAIPHVLTHWFVCLARDCARTLSRHLAVIEKLESTRLRVRMVVVENDSVDGTKELLSRFAARHSWVELITLDGRTRENDRDISTGVTTFFGESRIGKMAWLRNQYMDFLDNHAADGDLVTMFDPDLAQLPFAAARNAIGHYKADGVMANSLAYREGICWWRKRVYYDTYALRRLGAVGPQRLAAMKRDQTQVRLDLKRGPLRVASAFGGLACYRWEAIKGRRYGCMANDDPEIQVLCEHEVFHRDAGLGRESTWLVVPEIKARYHELARTVVRSVIVIRQRILRS